FLVTGLQSFRGNGLDPHERPFDVGRLHCIEELGVFRSFHGDLSEENCVLGKLCQASHERKTLCPDRLQFIQSSRIVLLLSEPNIGERNRIKIVVGECDKPEAQPSELNDFLDHNVRRTLSRALSISSPHGAKRAMLWTPAHGLDRCPHVAFPRYQVPTSGEELASFYPSTV